MERTKTIRIENIKDETSQEFGMMLMSKFEKSERKTAHNLLRVFKPELAGLFEKTNNNEEIIESIAEQIVTNRVINEHNNIAVTESPSSDGISKMLSAYLEAAKEKDPLVPILKLIQKAIAEIAELERIDADTGTADKIVSGTRDELKESLERYKEDPQIKEIIKMLKLDIIAGYDRSHSPMKKGIDRLLKATLKLSLRVMLSRRNTDHNFLSDANAAAKDILDYANKLPGRIKTARAPFQTEEGTEEPSAVGGLIFVDESPDQDQGDQAEHQIEVEEEVEWPLEEPPTESEKVVYSKAEMEGMFGGTESKKVAKKKAPRKKPAPKPKSGTLSREAVNDLLNNADKAKRQRAKSKKKKP